MSVRVAVVVLNWNGGDDTLDCLRSLARIASPQCDPVVVDNASSDGSAERVEREFPEARVLRNDENLGFAGGNNVGIRYALSQGYSHVLVLNNDTVVEPTAVSRLLDALSDYALAVVACPLMTYAESPDLVWYAGATFDPRRGRSGRMIGYR